MEQNAGARGRLVFFAEFYATTGMFKPWVSAFHILLVRRAKQRPSGEILLAGTVSGSIDDFTTEKLDRLSSCLVV